jgi:hypothetical protein
MKIFAVGRPNKKASLNLSINAIVVLVMAITVLGLGLTFIRGIFGGATAKLGGAISAASLKNPADSETPLTIDERVSIKAADKEEIEVGFYNRDINPHSVKLSNAGCEGDVITAGGTTDHKVFDVAVTSIAQEVDPGESIGYKAIFQAPSGADAPQGTYVCTLQAIDGTAPLESAQFFLLITG